MLKLWASWAQVISVQELFEPHNNENGTGTNFCLYCRKSSHDKKTCFKLNKKETQNSHAINFNGDTDQRNYESQDVVFTATSKNELLTDDI
jgi:hypothetical protein